MANTTAFWADASRMLALHLPVSWACLTSCLRPALLASVFLWQAATAKVASLSLPVAFVAWSILNYRFASVDDRESPWTADAVLLFSIPLKLSLCEILKI
jgi:hypothetical protein